MTACMLLYKEHRIAISCEADSPVHKRWTTPQQPRVYAQGCQRPPGLSGHHPLFHALFPALYQHIKVLIFKGKDCLSTSVGGVYYDYNKEIKEKPA